jgi:hypothetical protein
MLPAAVPLILRPTLEALSPFADDTDAGLRNCFAAPRTSRVGEFAIN